MGQESIRFFIFAPLGDTLDQYGISTQERSRETRQLRPTESEGSEKQHTKKIGLLAEDLVEDGMIGFKTPRIWLSFFFSSVSKDPLNNTAGSNRINTDDGKEMCGDKGFEEEVDSGYVNYTTRPVS